YTGSGDIIVGDPIYKQETESDFSNTVLVLRNNITGSMTFKQLLMQVRQTVVDAVENYSYPVEILAEQLGYHNSKDDFPLFEIALMLENIHDKKHLGHIPYRMLFVFKRNSDTIEGRLEYDPAYYQETSAERIARCFNNIAASLLENIDRTISGSELISEEEKKQVLYEFNGRNYPAGDKDGKTLHELFENQVKRTPERVAIVGRDNAANEHTGAEHAPDSLLHTITYSELNERANRLARLLREKGLKPDNIAALIMERSIPMIISIFAVLKAGAAYMPIDPDYPPHRIKYLLQDSGVKHLVTGKKLDRNIEYNGERIDPGILKTGIYENEKNDLEKINTSRHLAYIIYTSGSTGKPKGVAVQHGSVTAYLKTFYQTIEITAEHTMIQQASYAFDAFVEEVYSILLKGGKIVMPGKYEIMEAQRLSRLITRTKANIIDCSPLLLNELNKLPGPLPIRTYISGGDVLKPEYVDNLLKHGDVYNSYGPTESTVCITFFKCRGQEENTQGQEDTTRIPIGKPLPGYNVFILDKYLKLMPVGVPGELCVAGQGVARGYLNNPRLTSEKFVEYHLQDTNHIGRKGDVITPPQSGMPSAAPVRIYRTSDLARWLPDGNIEFLGRIDTQVKLRGYRIELGELESILGKHEKIAEATAIIRESDSGDQTLCAYIVPRTPDTTQTIETLQPQALKEYLEQKLPAYMIPAYFIQLEKIPLTPNGKIDRNALPHPEVKTGTPYAAPRGKVQETLAAIWATVLGVEKETIGIDDNFFEMGGHSLNATHLVAQLHKELNATLPLAEIFKTPRIRELADYLKQTAKIE
ncbi:MAG: amino acid adenylation domain-containing protein, partial [bacterium]|nr:amino acid adenylation domain-containing protein [bacterium]